MAKGEGEQKKKRHFEMIGEQKKRKAVVEKQILYRPRKSTPGSRLSEKGGQLAASRR